MLRYRQSSLDSAAAPESWAQGSANADVCLTPLQGTTGCGASQRRLPTGGAANGIPLKAATPFSTMPRTVPPVTSACSIAAVAGAARQTHKVASQLIFIGDSADILRSLFSRRSPPNPRRCHGDEHL